MWVPRAIGVPVGAVGQLWTWTVAVVAVLVALVTGGRDALQELLSRLVRWRVGARWHAVVVLGPALMALLTAGVFTVLGGAWADSPFASARIAWALLPVLFVIAALTDGLGEELGWRGFALPRLQRSHTPLTASLVLGAVWATWHLPLLWTAGHVLDQQTPWLFLLDIEAKAILFTWVLLHTRRSVLIAVLFHAGLNVFAVPPALPTVGGPDPRLIAVAVEWVVTVAVVLGSGPVFSRLVRDPELLAPIGDAPESPRSRSTDGTGVIHP